MLDAVFQHRRKVRNVGDLACSPGNYLSLGKQKMLDLSDDAPACKLAVYGGGQVFQDCVDAIIYRSQKARKRVIWGVGISAKDASSMMFDIISAQCALIGSRNFGIEGCEYVPCASALSPLFDQMPAPTRDLVLFSHASKSKDLTRPGGIPEMSNDGNSFEQVLRFLASAETVVSNSYHGTYWAMCLGRKVLCVPFSDKFLGFEHNPETATPQNWPDAVSRAQMRPRTLSRARELNHAFAEKVADLL